MMSAPNEAWSYGDEVYEILRERMRPYVIEQMRLAEGVRARKVYLAEGTRWKDVWTDKVHEGGTDVERDAPLSRIPVFVREGAEVPLRG